jgi:hypothetical protein
MNSFLAAALRLIFPLAALGAALDILGTDTVDFFDADFDEDLIEGFDFADELFTDDERVVADRDEEERLRCASEPNGKSRKAAIKMRMVRRRIASRIIGCG